MLLLPKKDWERLKPCNTDAKNFEEVWVFYKRLLAPHFPLPIVRLSFFFSSLASPRPVPHLMTGSGGVKSVEGPPRTSLFADKDERGRGKGKSKSRLRQEGEKPGEGQRGEIRKRVEAGPRKRANEGRGAVERKGDARPGRWVEIRRADGVTTQCKSEADRHALGHLSAFPAGSWLYLSRSTEAKERVTGGITDGGSQLPLR
ncbi:hypothetical protein BDK51DRAFT_25700 [Blyttiomyces helicus]|uniref:Uncharacterized protein n=1 Tax=Blyttiomyces helicus TaxID=388810 RepID=A0A4P9W5K3_9FUNG|nr:hypothetical protein BDK51DRAFT_25700 [Blyttiomyces helicus]|eukprot:RKO87691.1 hypothetical protein BDK51DRAFT_25700 [Blyttiomyces helicus]